MNPEPLKGHTGGFVQATQDVIARPDVRGRVMSAGEGSERMDVADAALALNLSYNQVTAAVCRGQLVGGKDGRRWWVSRSSVREAIARAR